MYASAIERREAGAGLTPRCRIQSLTGDAVNTFLPLENIEKMGRKELEDFYEIWLTTSETWPQDPERTQRKCLWRAERELTQDVEIDEAFFQNLPRLWVKVADLNDTAALEKIQKELGTHFSEVAVKGEFFPADKPKVACEDKNTDLRS
ncbi:hypothetical protein [Pseudomonas sp. UBA1879]|uniref:hypothetical protein n=1 Tax=Pseudomonas sp. UBA1879 TaxID=1947305 RepID=UPI0025FA1936|nr:hypothetical protein [Pseudomonas sp. UBA1879]